MGVRYLCFHDHRIDGVLILKGDHVDHFTIAFWHFFPECVGRKR